MPFVVTSCAFKIHRASGPGRSQPHRVFRTCIIIYACAQLIDEFGHATRSVTVQFLALERSRFRKIALFFQAHVVLKPLVSLIGRLVACSARISVDTQTHRQTDKPTTVTLAVHARRGLTRPSVQGMRAHGVDVYNMRSS